MNKQEAIAALGGIESARRIIEKADPGEGPWPFPSYQHEHAIAALALSALDAPAGDGWAAMERLAAKAALRGQLKKEREQHGQQVASSASPTRSSQGSRVAVSPRGQDRPEEGRARVVGQPTDAAGVRRVEPGVVDEPPWHRSDPTGAPAIERENYPADSVQERDADRPSCDRSDPRDGSGLTIAETERHMAALCDEDAEVTRWEKCAKADPMRDDIPSDYPVKCYVVMRHEIDAAVRIMRERGAEIARLRKTMDKASVWQRVQELSHRAEKAEWERDEAKREIKSDMENYKARWTRCEPYLDASTNAKSWDEIICMFAEREKTTLVRALAAEAEVARLQALVAASEADAKRVAVEELTKLRGRSWKGGVSDLDRELNERIAALTAPAEPAKPEPVPDTARAEGDKVLREAMAKVVNANANVMEDPHVAHTLDCMMELFEELVRRALEGK